MSEYAEKALPSHINMAYIILLVVASMQAPGALFY